MLTLMNVAGCYSPLDSFSRSTPPSRLVRAPKYHGQLGLWQRPRHVRVARRREHEDQGGEPYQRGADADAV